MLGMAEAKHSHGSAEQSHGNAELRWGEAWQCWGEAMGRFVTLREGDGTRRYATAVQCCDSQHIDLQRL
jgi:hypothetical protein